MFGFLKYLFTQPTFNRKFLFNLFGFIDISDESDAVRMILMRELIRAQAQFSAKIALICPPEYLKVDEIMEYNKKAPNARIFSQEIDEKTLLELVNDEYSIFIYDLKQCLDKNIITEDTYFAYKKHAANYYYNSQQVEPIVPHITYCRYDVQVKYVTDITGLDKKFTSKSIKNMMLNKLVNEKTDHRMRDCFYEFYFYDPTNDRYEQKRIEEFLKKLFSFGIDINERAKEQMQQMNLSGVDTNEQQEEKTNA